MTDYRPLTTAELLAAERRHMERLSALRNRGWGRTRPLTRNEACDMTLDHWELKRTADA